MNYLSEPFKSLKKTKNLASCAMLVSLSAVSSYLMSFYPTDFLKISITFLFVAAAAMKFGPVIAAVTAVMSDVIGYISKPVGPYQPLLTLSAALSGIIFGLFLYKNKTEIWRIVVSRAIIVVLISSFLDTYFISILYGRVFWPLFFSRGIKNLILFPIETFLLTVVLRITSKITADN